MTSQKTLTGGCQCGAVRFRITEEPISSTICHCRMCQKAFGSPFASLVEVEKSSLTWTRGKPSYFKSSDRVRRGFCQKCGTPLTYEHREGVEIATGAFDDPAEVPPTHQVNHSARLPFFEQLAKLPATDENEYAEHQAQLINFQHPDRDTEEWPPEFWFTDDHY